MLSLLLAGFLPWIWPVVIIRYLLLSVIRPKQLFVLHLGFLSGTECRLDFVMLLVPFNG